MFSCDEFWILPCWEIFGGGGGGGPEDVACDLTLFSVAVGWPGFGGNGGTDEAGLAMLACFNMTGGSLENTPCSIRTNSLRFDLCRVNGQLICSRLPALRDVMDLHLHLVASWQDMGGIFFLLH